MEAKRLAAEKAASYVRDGMTVGLGTGSTASWAIKRLGERVREGLSIRAVATSVESERLAEASGISLVPFAEVQRIDVTIDGADEVDPHWNLIKGGGGALLREKIVAAASGRLIVVVDESKLVRRLGAFPLPVEVVSFGHELTIQALERLGCRPVLRLSDNRPFVTDGGHYIADCRIGAIHGHRQLHERLNAIPGVVENGLFMQMASQVIVGFRDGTVRELQRTQER
ncbi:ribose-5-phosphate isomerase RpiA [Paenibacillus hodogayensis]|uniref:Ribose-5-phosphate isomerase A n=1 Tax=Paenibacillus hodogayensis TaxID=279208 RepID=A0ABV5W4G9_9BACL